jgi:CBS domain-containing protein
MELKKIPMHEVLKVGENEDLKVIAEKMKEKEERRVFVTDEEGKLKGVLTTTDIVYKAVCETCDDCKAKDIMTADVKSIEVSEDLNRALEVMNEIKSFTCPVTENGKIVGVISYHDLMNYVMTSIEQ